MKLLNASVCDEQKIRDLFNDYLVKSDSEHHCFSDSGEDNNLDDNDDKDFNMATSDYEQTFQRAKNVDYFILQDDKKEYDLATKFR